MNLIKKHIAAVALMLAGGFGMSSAQAAQVDNLTLEVRVNIPGIVDLQWTTNASDASGTSGTTGVTVGPNDFTTDPKIDSNAAGVSNAGANDKAVWAISSPGVGDIRTTGVAPDDTVKFWLDNIGNKKLVVTALITNQDSIAAGTAWTQAATAGTDAYSLRIGSSSAGTGGFGASGAPAGVVAVPVVAPTAGGTTLSSDFRRYHHYLSVNLVMHLPLEVANDGFDADHVITLAVVGTAN